MPYFEVEVVSRFLVEAESDDKAKLGAVDRLGVAISEGYADVSVSVRHRESRDDVDYRLADMPVLDLD